MIRKHLAKLQIASSIICVCSTVQDLRSERYTPIKSLMNHLRMPHRANGVLPLTHLPGVMRALRHPWLRSP
ncbi:hypothetical protein FXF61_09395 [Pseudomonas sp. C27(2019)]|nr:hypothetical protein FXF61_09395 [Pseudomonas sp. C27(2019)]